MFPETSVTGSAAASILGLARAAAVNGETAQSQKARERFPSRLEECNPDLAPLREAKAAYGKS